MSLSEAELPGGRTPQAPTIVVRSRHMTAVPTATGPGVQLICDGCGDVAVAGGGALPDAEVVYVAVAEVGWTGSASSKSVWELGLVRGGKCRRRLQTSSTTAAGPVVKASN